MGRRSDWRCGLAVAIALLASTLGPTLALAQTPPAVMAYYQYLAYRFRPYLKTSLDGNGKAEAWRPASWKWVLSQPIEMVQNYKSTTDPGCAGNGTGDKWPQGEPVFFTDAQGHQALVTSALINQTPGVILKPPLADIRASGAVVDTPGYALHFDYGDSYAGEDWPAVILAGDGFYAHVEQITGGVPIFNIEYTIVWAYNDAYCSHHVVDITTMTVVYDAAADLLTRVTYSVHGVAILSFRAAAPLYLTPWLISGQDAVGNPNVIFAVQVTPRDGYQMGDDFTAGAANFLLAADPDTGLYEHPVLFSENGSHELFPNQTAGVIGVPKHQGEGVSFFPSSVQVVDPDDTTDNNPDAPFLFLNGKFGSDGNPPPLHRTWLWPEGRAANRFGIPDKHFSDKDPYVAKMTPNLIWPPLAEYATYHPNLYVGGPQKMLTYLTWRLDIPALPQPTSILSAPDYPFADVFSAVSFAPCGSTVMINEGNYAAKGTLARQCSSAPPSLGPIILQAVGGPVVLGKS